MNKLTILENAMRLLANDDPSEAFSKMRDHALGGDNLRLLFTGDFADAEIHCQGKVWKVHKLILSARSPFFAKALNGPWQESTTGQVNLDEWDKGVLNMVISYIYGDDLPGSGVTIDGGHPLICLRKYAIMWAQADCLQLEGLVSKVSVRLQEKLAEALYDLYTTTNPKLSPVLSWGSPDKNNSWLKRGSNLDVLFADLDKAVRVIYGIQVSAARRPQLAFSSFILALREHMPQTLLSKLMDEVPDLAEDIHYALVKIHFLQIKKIKNTMYTKYKGWLPAEVFLNWPDTSVYGSCVSCYGSFHPGDGVVSCPWTLGGIKWCKACGRDCLFFTFKTITEELLAVDKENEETKE
ncbi:hypothetical protein N0V82_008789 [Gnomoniopsis sp. IMI 355080]|nr:hypothetical protein N0V82_008789 [Gnomoniopsis sp. IMI 355080]